MARSEALHTHVWGEVRRRGSVSVQDLSFAGASETTFRGLLTGWERDGVLVYDGKRRGRLYFRAADGATDDVPPAPTRAEGGTVAKGAGGRALWTAARRLGEFSPLELSGFTEAADEAEAAAFCKMLLRGGYLRVTRKAVPGQRRPRYRLIRDTGPVPPVEKRLRAVWDENLGEYTHIPEAC
ncbi:MAG: hypothetical protein ACU0BF_09210 [Paracoccaceae bacterium]